MDQDESDAPYWTLEQALIWILTRSRHLVAENSGATLVAALISRASENEFTPVDEVADPMSLRECLSRNKAAREIFDAATRILVYAFKSGKVAAFHEADSGRVWRPIEKTYWINHTIALGQDDILTDQRARGPQPVGYAPYGSIRVERKDVLAEWTEERQSARATTSRAEAAAIRYFVERMKLSPDVPTMLKETGIKNAMRQIKDLGPTAAERAWKKAAKAEAPAWSKGGRRPKEISAKQSKHQ